MVVDTASGRFASLVETVQAVSGPSDVHMLLAACHGQWNESEKCTIAQSKSLAATRRSRVHVPPEQSCICIRICTRDPVYLPLHQPMEPSTAGTTTASPSSSSSSRDFFEAAAYLYLLELQARRDATAAPAAPVDASDPAPITAIHARFDAAFPSHPPPLAAAAQELAAAQGELNALVNLLHVTRSASSATSAGPHLFERRAAAGVAPSAEWFARAADRTRGHKSLALSSVAAVLREAADARAADLPAQRAFVADLTALAALGWRVLSPDEAQRLAAAAPGGGGAAVRLPPVPHVVVNGFPTLRRGMTGGAVADAPVSARTLAPLFVSAVFGGRGVAAASGTSISILPPFGHKGSRLVVGVTTLGPGATFATNTRAVVELEAAARGGRGVVSTGPIRPALVAAATTPIPVETRVETRDALCWQVAAAVAAERTFDALTLTALVLQRRLAAAEAAGDVRPFLVSSNHNSSTRSIGWDEARAASTGPRQAARPTPTVLVAVHVLSACIALELAGSVCVSISLEDAGVADGGQAGGEGPAHPVSGGVMTGGSDTTSYSTAAAAALLAEAAAAVGGEVSRGAGGGGIVATWEPVLLSVVAAAAEGR